MIKLWVAAELPVSRGLLRAQLWFVPSAAAALMVWVAAWVSAKSGIATGWHARAACALTGAVLLLSAFADLTTSVVWVDRHQRAFWDDGDGYRPA